MRTEVLRVLELSARRNIGCNLDRINMYLYEGEVLGIVGLHDSGKSFFFDCLTGKGKAESGKIFLNEEPYLAEKWTGSEKIFRIQHDSALVENCSVMESIFVIRGQKRPKLFVPWKALRIEARECLKEFQIEIDPDRKVSELTLVERHMAEILKGYISGAKLILIDDVMTPYSVADYSKLDKVIRRFQEKGISFIICGCQLENLQRLTERCLFMVNGNAIKTIDNVRRKQIDEMKIFMAGGEKRLKAAGYTKRKAKQSANVLFELPYIIQENGKNVPLQIKEGEIVVVVDLFQEKIAELQNDLNDSQIARKILLDGKPLGRKKQGIYMADFLKCDYMINSLTFRDNLCIAAYQRIATLGFLNPVKAKVVERLFREKYQINAEHYEFNWEDMSFAEKMAVYLERINIQRWKVMICTNIENVMSYELEEMVKEELANMIKGKRSICIFASSFEKYLDFADYFLVPLDDKSIKKFTSEELREYFEI